MSDDEDNVVQLPRSLRPPKDYIDLLCEVRSARQRSDMAVFVLGLLIGGMMGLAIGFLLGATV